MQDRRGCAHELPCSRNAWLRRCGLCAAAPHAAAAGGGFTEDTHPRLWTMIVTLDTLSLHTRPTCITCGAIQQKENGVQVWALC